MLDSTVNLYLYSVMPNGETVQTGRILSTNLQNPGRLEGYFRYSDFFLSHPLAYPLDPKRLPLEQKTFEADDKETGLHGVFSDSLPDAWGEQLLARKVGIHRERYAPIHLLQAMANGGLGRFLYSTKENIPQKTDTSIKFDNISKALAEAGKLESSIDTKTSELQHILACGTSAGGARPKVLTVKNGIHWIAKFSSKNDPHPSLFVALEEAGLSLAKRAGLDVPKFQKISVNQRDLLLIKRFDVTDNGGRNQIASFKTLTGINDPYGARYADLAEIIRLYSTKAKRDLELLFRQMVVNVLLINTDDHLQNFAMINTKDGWRLSPSYDIVPNIYQLGQIIQVNNKHENICHDDLINEGICFGLPRPTVVRTVTDVCQKLARWELSFDKAGVPLQHCQQLKRNIAKRIKNIKQE